MPSTMQSSIELFNKVSRLDKNEKGESDFLNEVSFDKEFSESDEEDKEPQEVKQKLRGYHYKFSG